MEVPWKSGWMSGKSESQRRPPPSAFVGAWLCIGGTCMGSGRHADNPWCLLLQTQHVLVIAMFARRSRLSALCLPRSPAGGAARSTPPQSAPANKKAAAARPVF